MLGDRPTVLAGKAGQLIVKLPIAAGSTPTATTRTTADGECQAGVRDREYVRSLGARVRQAYKIAETPISI
jgi:hypothetical protein